MKPPSETQNERGKGSLPDAPHPLPEYRPVALDAEEPPPPPYDYQGEPWRLGEKDASAGDARCRSRSPSANIPPEGVEIATMDKDIRHGFPYSKSVCETLDIDHASWRKFSREIADSISLSFSQKAAVGGAGVGGAVLDMFVAVLVGLPILPSNWHGDIGEATVARETGRAAVRQLHDDESAIARVLKRWNDEHFVPKGFQVHLELPQRLKQLEELEEDSTGKLHRSKAKKVWSAYFSDALNGQHDVHVADPRFKLVFTPCE